MWRFIGNGIASVVLLHRNDKKLVASVELAMGLPRRAFSTSRNDKKLAASMLGMEAR
ncbi:MAG: hypothetical protein IIU83_01410 [Fibrobacteraceae bacterium]|nr:hypothetical protein [Fibrobacteraceae bacterium]